MQRTWTRVGYVGTLLSCCVFCWACSSTPPVNVGVDFSPEDIDQIDLVPAATSMPPVPVVGSQTPDGLNDVVDASQCPSDVAPCGGLLAGTWEMVDTCDKVTTNPKALQLWGQAVMNLDVAACGNAVQSVTSQWTGKLVFEGGEASDQRMRSDVVDMILTRSCLNATYDVTIKAEKMGSVCSTLTNETRSCTSVDGACHCSSRRESGSHATGVYGVLDKAVVIGSDDPRTSQFFDYCVTKGTDPDIDPDTLSWREESSGRRMAMRRVSSNGETSDPTYVR